MQDSLYPLDDAGKYNCATESARVMVFTGNAVSTLLEVAVCYTGVRPEGREEMSSLPVLLLLPCYTCTFNGASRAFQMFLYMLLWNCLTNVGHEGSCGGMSP